MSKYAILNLIDYIIRRIESLRFHDEEERLFSESVYGQYREFLRAMVKWERGGNLSQFIQDPWESDINTPRKVMKTPIN